MEGIVTVLKPPAMSSSDVVVDIRKLFETKRVGHLGTLDPEAAGVLPVCVGRAVRLFDYLVDKPKEYLAEIVFGIATDTQDAQGMITERSEKIVSESQLQSVLPLFCGEMEQIAPIYSALKHNGKKLYDLARAGSDVPEKKRSVILDRIEYIEQTGKNRFLIRIACSRGTYIRTLCADIGVSLGVPAHMSFLLRTSSGPFRLEQAYTIAGLKTLKDQDLLAAALIPCEKALSFLPPCVLADNRMKPSLNGLETSLRDSLTGPVRLYSGQVFLGIGLADRSSVKLVVNLFENDSSFR